MLIRRYAGEHYWTIFNPTTGFFARIEENGYEEPFWSQHGPELLDISITNWCDRYYEICYKSSGGSGQHMSLSDYEIIMRQAQDMHVAQVATGGGNPNQHPDFVEILRLSREKFGIVPSYTTNGRGLTKEVLEASRKYCGAVAVSAHPPYDDLILGLGLLKGRNIKANIHFVLDRNSIDTAIAWLENPPDFLNGLNAIVFLNYKPIGRSTSSDLLLKMSDKVEFFFEIATSKKQQFKIGFDSCSVSGLARFSGTDSRFYDGCEAARFSMFVSEKMEMYPCSFMENSMDGTQIQPDNMLSTWKSNEQFLGLRNMLASERCPGCEKHSVCLGGCPIFEKINLCEDL